MTDPLPHRHNGGPLNDDDARKLWNHVRAVENLEEQKAEIGSDIKARKELAKADGFDPNIVMAVVKRRKIGAGETFQADTLLRLYEAALEEQGALPLEQTRVHHSQRRSTEQIAQDLHGEEPPPLVRLNGDREVGFIERVADKLEEAGYTRIGDNAFQAPARPAELSPDDGA